MANRPVILSTTQMHEDGLAILRAAGELRMASSTRPEALRREIAEADALVVRTAGQYDADLMAQAPRLKIIGRHGVGYDHIDVPAATSRGVHVVTTPGANTESVCQHALGFMIGLSKFFPQVMAALRAGDYESRTRFIGRDLTGRTLGIIGFGRIGRRVGEVARLAFGMNVLYNDVVAAPADVEARAGARRVDLDELLREAEYVTLHVPLDDSTYRLMNAAAIAKLRPEAILVNTCRGPVVDEAAVAKALEERRIWGYAADVFDEEPPPPDHPLIGRPDVMLTPHSCAATAESLRNMAVGVAEDVAGVLQGEPPRNPVNDPAEVAAVRRRLERSP